MRLRPASCAAWSKLVNDRWKAGCPSAWSVKATWSLKNEVSTVLAAALNVLCPDTYSGNGGVTISGCQVGSGVVAALPSVSAWGMASMGRQKVYVYLASQAA